jgi:hypothetical protein
MIKVIKRTTDNKYLKSVETETWVDNIKDAYEMSYRECEVAKSALSGVFSPEQIIEIVNFSKSKPITEDEKREIMNVLKR